MLGGERQGTAALFHMTNTDDPSTEAYRRLGALTAAGYRIDRKVKKEALALHHPSRRRRHGAPPSVLIYPDGLVATYPQARAARLRFAAGDEGAFDGFLARVPRPTAWEKVAPIVRRGFTGLILSSFAAVVLWNVFDGQVAVIGFVTHLILFSAPFVAIRLFLK